MSKAKEFIENWVNEKVEVEKEEQPMNQTKKFIEEWVREKGGEASLKNS